VKAESILEGVWKAFRGFFGLEKKRQMPQAVEYTGEPSRVGWDEGAREMRREGVVTTWLIPAVQLPRASERSFVEIMRVIE
jgi:hypothetical protein